MCLNVRSSKRWMSALLSRRLASVCDVNDVTAFSDNCYLTELFAADMSDSDICSLHT